MTALRKAPNTTDYPSGLKGSTNADLLNEEITGLWARISDWLTNVAGTANAITAEASVTLDQYARPCSFFLVPAATNSASVTINIDSLGAQAIVAADGDPLTGGELVSGELALIIYDGSDFRLFSGGGTAGGLSPAPDFALQDTKTSGQAGGTFTSGAWRQRQLDDTPTRDALSGASADSDTFTLPAGSFWVVWEAPANRVHQHRARLYNVTDGAVVDYGTSEMADNVTSNTTWSRGAVFLTLTSPKAFRIEHRCQTTRSSDGFGAAASLSASEIYTRVMVWKASALDSEVEGRHGGAVTIEYLVDLTSTAKAYPGQQYLRFDNATQNLVTGIYASETDYALTDYGATLATLTEGRFRIVKADDRSKWLIGQISANSDEGDYVDLTVSIVDSSAANPFAQGDRVLFTHSGDATVADVLSALGVNSITVSTSDPSGGSDNDLWIKVPA